MADIQPTVDHIGDDTLTRELRNLASQVDKNETALNQEMASISEAQQEVDQKIAGFHDAIDQNTQDITTIKGNIQTIEQDITAVEQKNTEQDTAIDQNETAIQNEAVARQNADTAEQTAREDADVTAVDLSYNAGAIAIQLTREEGNMQDSVTCPFIKTATLVPTSTERAFKIQFEFQDGTQYDTNEFLIPEGGGTDVSVTGVTVVDGTAPDSFQVQIQLSDGEPLKSNDYTIDFPTQVNIYPTAVNMSLSGTTLNVTIVLNNGTNVQGTANLSGLLTGYATQEYVGQQVGALKLSKPTNNQVQLNGESINVIDNVTPQIVDGNTLRVEVNGVAGQVTLPASGGVTFERLSFPLPNDFQDGDIILVQPLVYSSTAGDIFTGNRSMSYHMITISSEGDYGCNENIYTEEGIITIATVYSLSHWNDSSGESNILNLQGYKFGGGQGDFVTVQKGNVGTYFKSMVRVRF